MRLNVIIAPDSFKGSLPAQEAAAAIAAGWRELRPHDNPRLLPQADGGEGTLDAIEHVVVESRRHTVTSVTGPDGRPTAADWLELPGGIAVIELAQSSGLPLMAAPDALGATTRGLGEVIRAAMASGIRSLVIALGGSASTDGGAGALQSLGLRLLQSDGSILPAGGGALERLRRIDDRDLIPPPPGGVTLLTDVTAPLLGPNGAANTFAPQKGAETDAVHALERGLSTWAAVLGADPAQPGAGAAGGTAYGLASAWGARIEPGAAWIGKVTGLADAVRSADVVITGEGRFDASSLTGKVVGHVLEMEPSQVGVIAGSVAVQSGSCWSCSLAEISGSIGAAMSEPEKWLREAGRAAAGALG